MFMKNIKELFMCFKNLIIKLPVLIFVFLGINLYSQTTLYSENFEDANDESGISGLFGSTNNNPSDNNWSVVKVGSPGLANNDDYCGVVTGKYLEWRDINGDVSKRVDWYSKTINTSASSIAISIDWEMYGAFQEPNANFYFYYKIDGGSWTNFFTKTGQSTLASGIATVSGLSCSTSIDLKVEGWTGDASGAYERIDNISIQGTVSSCTPPSISPSGLSIDDYSSYSVDLSWINNSGDNVVVVAHKTSESAFIPISGITYTADAVYGLGQEISSGSVGNFVVYKGSGTSCSVTGLTSGLSYTFDVYAADGTCFNTTALSGTQLLPCPSSSDPPFTLPAKFRTCGSESGKEISNDGTLSFNIEVSGLSTPLDDAANGLRQVKVFLKNGSNENLSLYSCTLTSPTAKASSTIFTTGSFATSVSSAQVTFRESSRLNPPSSSAVKPYDIGLYRITTADDFTTKFDGLSNPNGTWTVTFAETAGSALDDIQLDYVELEFGPAYPETDISAFGKNCGNAYELLLGNYLSSNSNSDTDDGNQPTKHSTCGNGISGCGCWNASYNEAQYLKFTASSTYFSMSLSGIQASSGDIQVIVVKGNPTPCSGHGNWNVVTCPESSFDNTTNSLDGRSHTGNGSILNFDLSMDNAVIGSTYYIIIDGNTSATANYYINVTDGVAKESVLPISLISFKGEYKNNVVELDWVTESEKNNDYFTIERSSNAIEFTNVGEINGSGNSNITLKYFYSDNNPLITKSYYRLKQTDFDGKYTYSNIITVSQDKIINEYDLNMYYSKSENSFIIEFVAFTGGVLKTDIYNSMAQNSLVSKESFTQGYNRILIPFNGNQLGLYMIKVNINNRYYTEKALAY